MMSDKELDLFQGEGDLPDAHLEGVVGGGQKSTAFRKNADGSVTRFMRRGGGANASSNGNGTCANGQCGG